MQFSWVVTTCLFLPTFREHSDPVALHFCEPPGGTSPPHPQVHSAEGLTSSRPHVHQLPGQPGQWGGEAGVEWEPGLPAADGAEQRPPGAGMGPSGGCCVRKDPREAGVGPGLCADMPTRCSAGAGRGCSQDGAAPRAPLTPHALDCRAHLPTEQSCAVPIFCLGWGAVFFQHQSCGLQNKFSVHAARTCMEILFCHQPPEAKSQFIFKCKFRKSLSLHPCFHWTH